MSNLKNVISLKLQVSDGENALMNVLRMVIASWIDRCGDLDTRNINLVFLSNYDELDQNTKEKDPLLYLYPKRKTFKVSRPKNGFEKPIRLFEPEMEYKHLRTDAKKAIVLQKITDLIAERKDFIDQKRDEYYTRHPKPILGPGEGWWKAFEIEFDTAHEYPFFFISFSGYETPA